MKISISKKDIIWNYVTQFFNLGSGLLVLPVILHMLSPAEIGMNYLMLSISSMVALADFGFSDQFGRNITYVFSGARKLEKEGLNVQGCGTIDYHLLAVVIETARFIYRRISLFVLLFMLTVGTLYMYKVTDGFFTVNNSLIIWALFSISTFFNIYFLYYGALLTGAAMIMESKKAILLNRITYIVISFVLLFCGCGLISIVIANLISPFVGRWYSYKSFFQNEMKDSLRGEIPSKKEVKETFNILWYNAKKLGINFIGAYGIQQSGTFLIGLFLTLEEVASYGLMCQLFQISTALALTVFNTYLPVFYKERVEGNIAQIRKDFSFSSFIYIVVFSTCGIVIVLWGKQALDIVGSKTVLPAVAILGIYFIHMFLENFHSICATMIVTGNRVPFVKAAIYSGVAIVLLSFLILQFTSLGLLGVVLVQFLIQSIYNHWKWPLWIFKDLDFSFFSMLKMGATETYFYLNKVLRIV